MKKHTLLTALSLAALALTVLFSACGTQDTDGIFKDINQEIELDDAVVKGNIFDIVEAGGKLYAGGGAVYVKNSVGQKRGWRVFSDCPRSGGIIVRLAVSGNTLTVECAENTARGYFYTTGTDKAEWKSGGSIPSRPDSYTVTVNGKEHTVTCETAGTPKYYGTTSGAYYLNEGEWTMLPGKNTRAAIGNYRISAIYSSGGAVFVGTLGRGTTYGTKNNGLWAYYTAGNEWNRE